MSLKETIDFLYVRAMRKPSAMPRLTLSVRTDGLAVVTLANPPP